MTLDIYGRQLPAPSAFYDPESSCWRTSQPTLLSDSTASSLTLPAWGMTLGGALYELRTPGRLTSEPASSSLLPTPLTSDAKDTRSSTMEAGFSNDTLTDAVTILVGDRVRLLPTPQASDAERGSEQSDPKALRPSGAKKAISLADAIRHGVTTSPRSDDGNSSSAA